jgi:magnesium transporter
MSTRQAAELVTQMTPDDRADVLEELEEDRADEILSEIPEQAREETERLLAYEPDTAGGLMTTEFVSVSEDTRVEEALSAVRRIARAGRREAMHAIYATDVDGRVKGVMSLHELLAAPKERSCAMSRGKKWLPFAPTADRVGSCAADAELRSRADSGCDDDLRFIGVVTVDDVIDALRRSTRKTCRSSVVWLPR